MKLDTSKSTVSFSIKKMLFLTVKGVFPEVRGTVELNTNELSKSHLALSIPVTGLDTQNKKRNEHLQQEDFFHAEQYPEITFESQEIAQKDNLYVAKGTLNIAGDSNTIEIPFSFDNKRATGSFSLNRREYNLGKIPSFMAADNVNISFDCTVA